MHGYGSKSLRILRVLQWLWRPQKLGALHALLEDIPPTSLSAFLVGMVQRGQAARSGAPGEYRFALGPKGAEYLKFFHPLD